VPETWIKFRLTFQQSAHWGFHYKLSLSAYSHGNVPIVALNIRILIVRHVEKQFLSLIFLKRQIHTDREGHASYQDISCVTFEKVKLILTTPLSWKSKITHSSQTSQLSFVVTVRNTVLYRTTRNEGNEL